MKIKHVFFDLDHTLWDFERNSAKTFEYILKNNQINVNLESFLNHYKPINLKYWRLFRNEEVTKEQLRYKRLKETFDLLNFAIDDTMIDKLSEDYIDNLSNNNYLFEGTLDVLDYLKSKYTLHIITNGFEGVQHKKLKNSKLFDYFATITTSECISVKKPDPLIFEHALGKVGAKRSESIMIGDSYEADVQGAIKFGIKAVYCNYENLPVAENITSIAALNDLKNIL